MLQTYNAHLFSKNQLTQNIYIFRFILDDPKEIVFTPGQYLIMLIPQSGSGPASPTLQRGEPARRLYSLASPSSEKNSFELLVEVIPGGIASEFLLNLEPLAEVDFQGPAGHFSLRDNPKNKVFMVTGTGIAPVRSIIKSVILASEARYRPIPGGARPESDFLKPDYHLLWGLPTFKDVYLLDELKKLTQEHPNFTFSICLSRETDLNAISDEDRQFFKLGHVNGNLQIDLANTDYYLCGSRNVVESLKNYLSSNKVEDISLIYEKF